MSLDKLKSPMINEGEECGDCESTYVILVKCGVDFPWESLVVFTQK